MNPIKTLRLNLKQRNRGGYDVLVDRRDLGFLLDDHERLDSIVRERFSNPQNFHDKLELLVNREYEENGKNINDIFLAVASIIEKKVQARKEVRNE